MPEVIRAVKLGFCFGANSAFKRVNKEKKAYILGDVVHNKQVMELLAERDKIVINGVYDDNTVTPNKNTMDWLKKNGKDINRYLGKIDRPVVITAHGAKKEVFDRLENLDIKIIDTTCEKVKKIFQAGLELEQQGYHVTIFGDKNHPEVQGIASRLKNPIIVNNNIADISTKLPERIGIICQSTSIQSQFEKIAAYLKNKTNDCKIVNTICPATYNRQNAVLDLSKKSDVVIVIGGEHSSNTKKLREIAEFNCETHHIQVPEQLRKGWFLNKNVIGISAGASTPPWIIDDVEAAIKTMF